MPTKILITSGCSFTQYPNADTTWPFHLQNHLNCQTLFLGQGAAGNGIISKHILYNTLEALKTYKAEEILVGIMWTESSRFDFFSSDDTIAHTSIKTGVENYRNPVKIINSYNHYIVNPNFSDSSSLAYYRNFYDDRGSYLTSIDIILKTQWFLEKYKVPYFMLKAFNGVLPNEETENDIFNDPEINYWYKQIDMSKFIDQECLKWCKEESQFTFARIGDEHPSTEQHKEYTEQIIIPFLKSNNLIGNY